MNRPKFQRAIERAWLARGPLAIALLPLAALYGVVSACRRAAFRIGWSKVERLDVPVVVVGNLIVGGAGKTPTVMAVATVLRDAGWRPGIVSRGYGRNGDGPVRGLFDRSVDGDRDGDGNGDGIVDVRPDCMPAECGDEPLLIRRRTGLPVVVGRDRVAAARRLREWHPQVNVVVTDDGLQHLRLGRDVEIVVFDERGVGNGWLLPAGPLRERFKPRDGRSIVLYNASVPSTPWPGFMVARRLSGAVAIGDWQAGRLATLHVLRSLIGRPVVAVAATARPGRFFDMLRSAGIDVRPMPMPDHDRFDAFPWPADTPDVIVTEKDAVKLSGRPLGATRVWVAPLDFQPEPAFGQSLLQALGRLETEKD